MISDWVVVTVAVTSLAIVVAQRLWFWNQFEAFRRQDCIDRSTGKYASKIASRNKIRSYALSNAEIADIARIRSKLRASRENKKGENKKGESNENENDSGPTGFTPGGVSWTEQKLP